MKIKVELRFQSWPTCCVNIFYSGGLELLFDKKTNFEIELKDGSTLEDLIKHMKETYVKERPELFVSKDGSV